MDGPTSADPHPDRDTKRDKDVLPRAVSLLKDVGPLFYATAAFTVYVAGFIVLNAHLVKHGILDIDFVDARYALAGCSFVLYLVAFYLFAGRSVLFTQRWLNEDLALVNRPSPRPYGSVVIFAARILDLLFACCLSAALYTNFAIESYAATVFYSLLVVAFLVLYPLDVRNVDVKWPVTFSAISMLLKGAAVASFFYYSFDGSGSLFLVFLNYAGFSLYMNFVIDDFSRHRMTGDRLAFAAIYSAVALLVAASTFGAILFGQISPKVGGARPQIVTVGIDENSSALLTTLLELEQPLHARLIYQTPDFTYLEVFKRTVRVRTPNVLALVIHPEKDRSFWLEYIEKKKADELVP